MSSRRNGAMTLSSRGIHRRGREEEGFLAFIHRFFRNLDGTQARRGSVILFISLRQPVLMSPDPPHW